MVAARGADGGALPRREALHLLVDLLAVGCELAMLVTLGLAGWRLGSGGLMSVALAALYPALAALVWSVCLAPTAGHRLGDPGRIILQALLFLAAGLVSALAGRLVWGIVLTAVALASVGAARYLDRPDPPAPIDER